MSSKRIIVVTGATGAQGGSVARYLLKDGTFAVRAITRNPDSAPAKELAAQGAQVVQADSRDAASLVNAFKGAYGAFGLTNYWEPGVGYEGEVSQGKLLVDAAKAAGLKHFVWSSLDHTHFKASHWESKAVVDDYLKANGVPRTSLFTAYYFENFTGVLSIRKRPDGSYEFPLPFLPDPPFAVYPASETGAYTLAAFLDPTMWLDQDMRIASGFLSIREMLTTIGEVSGKTVYVQEVTEDQWNSAKGTLLPEEIHTNMSGLFYFGKPPFRDMELSHKLNPGMKTFRQWVEENVDKVVI